MEKTEILFPFMFNYAASRDEVCIKPTAKQGLLVFFSISVEVTGQGNH